MTTVAESQAYFAFVADTVMTVTANPTLDTVLGTYSFSIEAHYASYPHISETRTFDIVVTACVVTSLSLTQAMDQTHVVGAGTTS